MLLTTPQLSTDYTYYKLEDEFDWGKFEMGRSVALDIETFPMGLYKDKEIAVFTPKLSCVRLLQFYDGENAVVIDLGTSGTSYRLAEEEFAKGLYKFLTSRDVVICHNAVFEASNLLHVFQEHEFEYAPIPWVCSEIAFNMVVCADDDSKLGKGSPSTLGNCVKVLEGIELPKDQGASDWSSPVLSREQLDYAILDSIACFKVFNRLLPVIREDGMERVYLANCEAIPTLALMRVEGACVDRELHLSFMEGWQTDLDESREEVFYKLNFDKGDISDSEVLDIALPKVLSNMKDFVIDIVGELDHYEFEDLLELSKKFWKLHYDNVEIGEVETKRIAQASKRAALNIDDYFTNPGSSKQMAEWITEHFDKDVVSDWGKTEKGSIKTGAGDWARYAPQSDIADTMKKYAKFKKLVTSYSAKLQDYMVDIDDKTYLFPSFTLSKTVTGRMSSYEPNFQNVPSFGVGSELRDMFIPRGEGRKIISADFSQVEYRVLAYMSKDEKMLKVYQTHGDLHAATTQFLGDHATIELAKKDKELRSTAKNVNFLIAYGGGAKNLIDTALKGGKKMTKQEAWDIMNAFYENYPGAKKVLDEWVEQAEKTGVSSTSMGKLRGIDPKRAYTVGKNNPIQGTAAEIQLASCWHITHNLKSAGVDCKVFNIVHDEFNADCSVEDLEESIEIIEQSMVQGFLDVFPEGETVGLVDISVVDNWGQAK